MGKHVEETFGKTGTIYFKLKNWKQYIALVPVFPSVEAKKVSALIHFFNSCAIFYIFKFISYLLPLDYVIPE